MAEVARMVPQRIGSVNHDTYEFMNGSPMHYSRIHELFVVYFKRF